MAGRGARSDRGSVRGALVDEFTHVITGGTTRNRVLKQSPALSGRCSALCRRQETGRHSGRGRGTGCLFGRTRHVSPPVRTVQRAAPEPAVLRPPGAAILVIGTQPTLGRELAFRKNGYVWRQSPVAAIARYPPFCRRLCFPVRAVRRAQIGVICISSGTVVENTRSYCTWG